MLNSCETAKAGTLRTEAKAGGEQAMSYHHSIANGTTQITT
jgi:hypothetical protein